MTVLALLAGATIGHAEVQVSVGEMSVDGLEVRSLECVLDRGGFLAAATVVGSLAQQNAALDACAPAGAAFAVTWTWGGAAPGAAVTGSSQAAANACISAALQTTQSALSGQCSAVILVGEDAAATAAAAALAAE